MAHGLFVDGVWQSQWYDTTKTGGRFVPTEPLDHRVRAAFPPSGSAITSTSRSRAPMRTAR